MALRTSLVAQPHLYMGDTTGRPLDAGKVYFGEPNKDPELYPIDVFYDEALTIAAPQPIRTKGGFLNANGDMTEVYAAEIEYSVKVLDSYGRQVFYQERMMSSNTDASVSTKLPYIGAVTRNQSEKNAEKISIKDFGLVADGATNDSAKIQDIESALSDAPIDLLGKTVYVESMPEGNRYMNGYFNVAGSVRPTQYVDEIYADNNLIAIGDGAGAAHEGAYGVRNCIAIGQDAMKSNTKGRHNIALGVSALHYLNGTDRNGIDGTRNIAIGGNTGRFMTTGSRNIIMGRDTGHCLTDAHINTIIGTLSFMGDCPNTITYGEIINQTPSTAVRNVSLGAETSMYVNTSDTVAVGYQALMKGRKSTGMVAIGSNAFKNHEADRSYWDTVQNEVSITGTYVQTNATDITVTTSSAHGLTTGFRVWMRFTTGTLSEISYQDDIWFQVTVIDTTKFTISYPSITDINGAVSGSSGAVSISKVSTLTAYSGSSGESVAVGFRAGDGTKNYRSTGVGHEVGRNGLGDRNTAIGYRALYSGNQKGENTAIGHESQVNSSGIANTSIGGSTLYGVTGNNNVAVGLQSASALTSGSDNVSLGAYAFKDATTANKCTALGVGSLRYTTTGGTHNYSNATGVGYNARVSADNQVQLGDSTTTTYAYGAIQNRSDERDKIIKGDVTDELIEFFNDVEFKRYVYDYRDDYITHDSNGMVVQLQKDGSKAGKREHLGVVAQQVEKAMKAHNVDFAGLQHHSKGGGDDIYTIGYQEFIPILGEIVQRQQKQIDELKALIKK